MGLPLLNPCTCSHVCVSACVCVCRYVFANPEKDGWLPAGKRHALVLKPQYEKLNPLQDLRLVQQQVEDDLKVGNARMFRVCRWYGRRAHAVCTRL